MKLAISVEANLQRKADAKSDSTKDREEDSIVVESQHMPLDKSHHNNIRVGLRVWHLHQPLGVLCVED